MSVLRDRNMFPPGGWQFYQPQTGWKIPTPTGQSFVKSVDLIIQHRLNNPALGLSTDVIAVSDELDRFTCLRLENDPIFVISSEPVTPKQYVEPRRCRTCG